MQSKDFDPYVYLGTDVLKNKLGIKNSTVLALREEQLTSIRMLQLTQKELPRSITFKQICLVHRHIFSDLYDWAGKIRTGSISKGRTQFCRPAYIQTEGVKICAAISQAKCFAELAPEEFIKRFAHSFNEMNVLHPFRDGNGRATRAFFNQIAAKANYQINYIKIGRDEWIDACIQGYWLTTNALEELFAKALVRLVPAPGLTLNQELNFGD